MKKLAPRDLARRKEEILDGAHDFLVDRGLASFGMDSLAARLPFSKGTLYNCFTSREDVLVALLARKARHCFELFRRASGFPGKPRERFYAISLAADIDIREDRLRSQFLADEEILAAASADNRAAFLQQHEAIVQLLVGIVQAGIDRRHLPAHTNPLLVTNATWSLYVGSEELRFRGFIYPGLSHRQFEENRLPMFNALLDGFHWKPLAHRIDFPSLRSRVLQEVFPDEALRHGL